MSRVAAAVLTAAAGGLIALQAPINSKLGHSLGTFQAASVSFLIGLVPLVSIALIGGGGLGALGHVGRLPWWYFLGGLLGAAYVASVLVTVRTLGAGGVTAATIAGQLTLAVLIDQFGIAGVAKHPISAARVAGVALLAAGVYLVVRN
jgi:bacterial/archaeal transporter family-2 protein